MNRSTHDVRRAATGALTALAGAALITGLAAAPASADIRDDATETRVVLSGAMSTDAGKRLPGNRHQLHLATHAGKVQGALRSYFCPAGASVTPTWASSRCTHRYTYKLTNFRQDGETSLVGRISSTQRSAAVRGPVVLRSATTGRSWLVGSDIALTKYQSSTIAPSGTFAAADLVRTSKRYAIFEKIS